MLAKGSGLPLRVGTNLLEMHRAEGGPDRHPPFPADEAKAGGPLLNPARAPAPSSTTKPRSAPAPFASPCSAPSPLGVANGFSGLNRDGVPSDSCTNATNIDAGKHPRFTGALVE
jgi:hypothetical protein